MTADRPADIGVSTGMRWQLSVERVGDDTALVHLAGSWKLEDRLPDPAGMAQQLPPGRPIRRLAFDAQGITAWDTGLLAYVSKLHEWAAGKSIEADLAGLPEGIQRLLRLAAAVPRRQSAAPAARLSWLARVGTATVATWQAVQGTVRFIGDVALASGGPAAGKGPLSRVRTGHPDPGVRRPGTPHRHAHQLPGGNHPGLHRGRSSSGSSAPRSTWRTWWGSPWPRRWAP